MSAARHCAGRLTVRWAWLVTLLVTLLGSLLGASPAAARPVPGLAGRRVVDEAGVLGATAARALEQRLAAYEARTGRQLAVLTVDSLQGDPLEDFSIRVVEAWALGRRGHDDGLLVVLAVQEQRVRIEVGYGLEGVVTDRVAARIIRDVMRPPLRQGRPGAAVSAGVEALIVAAGAAEEPEASPVETTETPSVWTRRYFGHPVFWYVLVSVTLAAVFGICLRWPLVGVIALLAFGRLWWPGSLVCGVALYVRWMIARRRSRRDGSEVEPRRRPPVAAGSGGERRGRLKSLLMKLGGLVTLLGIGRLLTSGIGRSLVRQIGSGGSCDDSGSFTGGGGGFGGGGASGG